MEGVLTSAVEEDAGPWRGSSWLRMVMIVMIDECMDMGSAGSPSGLPKAECFVAVDVEDRSEGLPVALGGVAVVASLVATDVLRVEAGDLAGLVVDPRVDGFGEFLAGQGLGGSYGGGLLDSSLAEQVVWFSPSLGVR